MIAVIGWVVIGEQPVEIVLGDRLGGIPTRSGSEVGGCFEFEATPLCSTWHLVSGKIPDGVFCRRISVSYFGRRHTGQRNVGKIAIGRPAQKRLTRRGLSDALACGAYVPARSCPYNFL